MTATLERETKWELDQSAFERLKTSGVIRKCIQQLNVYYDAGWRLADQSITCRVRLANRKRIATLKIPVSTNGGERVMKEFETSVSMTTGARSPHRRLEVARHLSADWRSEFDVRGIKSLARVGWMRNTRYVVQVDEERFLELDRMSLPDGSVVFEVENNR